MFQASYISSNAIIQVALDLNDVNSDGVWLDSNGEEATWDNWAAGYPEFGYTYNYLYAFMLVNWPTANHLLQKKWMTSHISTSVVCVYYPCANPYNYINDLGICDGPLSNVFTRDELLTCLDNASSDIEVGDMIYKRKTITGKRSGHGSILTITL